MTGDECGGMISFPVVSLLLVPPDARPSWTSSFSSPVSEIGGRSMFVDESE
jgi:hypothetical protein